nr:reverse transcriptase domain-containing protein [Tanacetum cinerariifolium]
MEALTTRIDSQFKEIRGDMKEKRDGCNKCRGPHPSSDYDDKPMGGSKEEEANYASEGYRGNYYGRNPNNWRDRQYYHRDENQNSNPGEENPPNPRFPKKRPDESYGKTYNPLANPNTKTVVYLDDSEDEAEEVEKEAETLSHKPTQTDTPPLKAYKPIIPYPQRLNKEKIEAHYAKFLDMLKEFRINVPLVDVHASMPDYEKFLKDLVSNKSKMEQIFATFVTEECSSILQYKIPPKLGDPESFLIPCKLANPVEYLALADLGASINLMPYSLYEENRVPLILGRPFLHTVHTIIRVKNKELNLGIGEDRATFHIDKAMQHSHVNDDTCFCMDVIDEITEDELDDLLDDSKPFLNTSRKDK